MFLMDKRKNNNFAQTSLGTMGVWYHGDVVSLKFIAKFVMRKYFTSTQEWLMRKDTYRNFSFEIFLGKF